MADEKKEEKKQPPKFSEPMVDGFKLKVNLKGSLKDAATLLRSISLLEVAPEKDVVNAVYVENRDIHKKPYVFLVMRFRADEIEFMYSVPPEIPPTRRRLDMIRYLMNILSLLGDFYEIDDKIVYQLIESSLKEMDSYASLDFKRLYTEYDHMKKKLDDSIAKAGIYEKRADQISKENYELKNRLDELVIQVRKMRGLSEKVLVSKVQEWVLDHNGIINISDFAKTFHVPDSRVEGALNKLVRDGYLELVQ